eukprot:TRINITY_DN2223_c0_g1_i1.p1 TRINITY_DN2223_c0_g1~~TRINITY_DN2223_c0_g1_i1.p1  ORF type:complete len:122 (-),score=41.04 TRINITY_DN2223_c0_g1_i1:17-337(-)
MCIRDSLRFPCCGKVYPCEKCHQEKETHQFAGVKNMICGFCSAEQKISLSCSECGKGLTKNSEHKVHWEGGKGQREKVLMSKKDSKKYVGNAKTLSKKQQLSLIHI